MACCRRQEHSAEQHLPRINHVQAECGCDSNCCGVERKQQRSLAQPVMIGSRELQLGLRPVKLLFLKAGKRGKLKTNSLIQMYSWSALYSRHSPVTAASNCRNEAFRVALQRTKATDISKGRKLCYRQPGNIASNILRHSSSYLAFCSHSSLW